MAKIFKVTKTNALIAVGKFNSAIFSSSPKDQGPNFPIVAQGKAAGEV